MRFASAGLKLASRTLCVRPAEGGFGTLVLWLWAAARSGCSALATVFVWFHVVLRSRSASLFG